MEKKQVIQFLEDNNFPNIKSIFEGIKYTPMVIEVIPTGVRMDFLIEEDDKVLTLEFINDTESADVFMSKSDLKNRDYCVTILSKEEIVNIIKRFFDKDYQFFENMIAQNKKEYNSRHDVINIIESIVTRARTIEQASTLVHCFNEHGRVLFAVLQNDIPFIVTLSDMCLVNVYALVSNEQFHKCNESEGVPYNGEITYDLPYGITEESRAKFHEAFKQYLGKELKPHYDYIIGWDFEHSGDYYNEFFLEDIKEIGEKSMLDLDKDILWAKSKISKYNRIKIDWLYIRQFILEISNTMK